MASFLLQALALVASFAAAEDAKIAAEDSVPDWVSDVALGMSLSTMHGQNDPYQYFVVPLTIDDGDAAQSPSKITVKGNMVEIDTDNFDKSRDDTPDEVAYLSCDETSDDSKTTPDEMVNKIMEAGPTAILLYSLSGNGCSLKGKDLKFKNIFSMIDSGDAQQALDFLNATAEDDTVHVLISGNVTESLDDDSSTSRGTSSAVAMSVLYSITGIVTLLFLVIICTGTIRAHRHPERYGLRSANGGRPRQSRAKGIARAVLDTIPIVKFSGSPPAKPDPDAESQDGESRRSSHVGVDGLQARDVPAADAGNAPSAGDTPAGIPLAPIAKAATRDSGQSSPPAVTTKVSEDDGEILGCTICTEDFTVGEDVRVLPCSHKFHPACVDPWLTNVSGTCPLCRLDLRPPEQRDDTANEAGMAPPLELDGPHDDARTVAQRMRVSRILDLARLRHASPEERIQALRQYRHSQVQEGPEDGGDRGRRARVADKLRDRFRVLTRAQSPGGS